MLILITRIRNLYNVLEDIDETICDQATADQWAKIQDSINGCEEVLGKLALIRDKNSELAVNATLVSSGQHSASRRQITQGVKRVWKRFRWDSGEITSLRAHLISNISVLNTVLTVVGRYAICRNLFFLYGY